jgi:hypothetical protein
VFSFPGIVILSGVGKNGMRVGGVVPFVRNYFAVLTIYLLAHEEIWGYLNKTKFYDIFLFAFLSFSLLFLSRSVLCFDSCALHSCSSVCLYYLDLVHGDKLVSSRWQVISEYPPCVKNIGGL